MDVKAMNLAHTFMCGAALAAFGAVAAGFDDLYTAETGYVTLERSDTTNGQSFDKAGN